MPVLEPSPPVLVPAVLVPAAVVPAAVVSAAVVPVVVEVLSAGSPVLSAPVGPELLVLTGSLVASPPVGGVAVVPVDAPVSVAVEEAVGPVERVLVDGAVLVSVEAPSSGQAASSRSMGSSDDRREVMIPTL